ncbi:hypothetical protein [Salinispora cortesiana]|uniref:hypothetical protein n=1 Tax=Salinispora cortesiana TaxID=1305843 RepID=UPI000408923B|nr:hypothetical protein [Salinispora cortesiana]
MLDGDMGRPAGQAGFRRTGGGIVVKIENGLERVDLFRTGEPYRRFGRSGWFIEHHPIRVSWAN